MKKIFILLLVMATLNSYAQSKKDKTKGDVLVPQKIEVSSDTTFKVEYVNELNKTENKLPTAVFVNGQLLRPFMKLDPKQIKNIKVFKRDTLIEGKKYYGLIFIKVKNYNPNYVPSPITLNDLKDQYTSLKNKSAIFTIDGRIINADYDHYKIDKNTILKIIVEKFSGASADKELWLVKVLTKTEENIKKSKQIMIRGSSGIVKN